jgi:hypothetical protein
MVIDGKKFTPKAIADFWLYGKYFHNDEDKRRLLVSLVPVPLLLSRQRFMWFCREAARQVLHVASLANASIRDGSFV